MKLEGELTNKGSTEIPVIDGFADLKAITKEVKAIIEKIDFVETNNKEILIQHCDDSVHFLESKEPKLFVMYISHTLRELTEKFFGEAKTVGLNDHYVFNTEIPDSLLVALDVAESYGFIEERNGHQIKMKRLIEIEERDRLLRVSNDELWHKNVWELNTTYANNDSSKRDLGTKQFFKAIPAKYSISSWTYKQLIKTRKALYKKLSGYAHGSKIKEIVEVLNKSANERGEKDNIIIKDYLEANKSIIEIFRPFESTTNEKIQKIDILLNE